MSAGTTLAVAVVFAAIVTACGGDSEERPEDAPEWLFVLSADEATLDDGRLTLEGVEPTVTMFADRPERLVRRVIPAQVVAGWSAFEFDRTPPNAAVTGTLPDGQQADAVVTLSHPVITADSVSFSVDGDAELAVGDANLFIDGAGGDGCFSGTTWAPGTTCAVAQELLDRVDRALPAQMVELHAGEQLWTCTAVPTAAGTTAVHCSATDGAQLSDVLSG